MKLLSLTKQINLIKTSQLAAVMCLLLITSCKKEDAENAPLKTKIVGRWEVSKIETTVGSTPPTTVAYDNSDYVDFKGTEDDIVEISLNNSSQTGTYSVTVGNTFNMQIGSKLYMCTPSVVEQNKLEFNATEDGSNPVVVRKYFLIR
ncbi:MAG: hypothetical protein EOO92_02295 [Pedobacter sp.]|nr:MAG: hypothetical protein EOO92_02295 [Pedobacter sp.]